MRFLSDPFNNFFGGIVQHLLKSVKPCVHECTYVFQPLFSEKLTWDFRSM